MNIVFWKLVQIKPYVRNARRIPQQAIDKVASSIQEFGWRQPIVVDRDGVIICGHTRLLAAQKLGLEEAPVHVADNLTPGQVRAYRLLDNRSHEEATWDAELLGCELLDLKDMGLDLGLTGFDAEEIDRFLAEVNTDSTGLVDDDEVPELSATVVTCPGDLWVLSDHKLLCGDATVATSYKQVLGDRSADLIVCDPPYNVGYRGGPRNRGGRPGIVNDDLGPAFEQFLSEVCQQILAVAAGSVYVCMSSSELGTLQKVFVDAGGHWSTFVIWAKNTFTLGRSDYQRQYEPILYGWREGGRHYWCGARDQGDVWFLNKPAVNDLHPTMKPVELYERAIRNSSRNRDLVLDPFAGSGTVLIACEKAGRLARAIELDPKYVDCAVKRWQDWSGKQAMLDGDGRSFADISVERLKRAA